MKVVSQPRRNIVGCRIQHVWKEAGGHVVWKGTVLDQVERSLGTIEHLTLSYMIKTISKFTFFFCKYVLLIFCLYVCNGQMNSMRITHLYFGKHQFLP